MGLAKQLLTVFLLLRLKSRLHLKMAQNVSEKACVYASIILADDQIEITADKISALLSAANVEVESSWPGLFAKAVNGIDVKAIVGNVGVGSGSAPAAGGAAASGEAAAAEEAKEEVKEESEEESDDDMGFGLFD